MPTLRTILFSTLLFGCYSTAATPPQTAPIVAPAPAQNTSSTVAVGTWEAAERGQALLLENGIDAFALGSRGASVAVSAADAVRAREILTDLVGAVPLELRVLPAGWENGTQQTPAIQVTTAP